MLSNNVSNIENGNDENATTPVTSLSDDYVTLFSNEDVVVKYSNKFTSRIEKIRHLCEVKQLAPHVRGKLLDCSVGTGRLIPHFTQVTEFHAADTSPEFLEYIKNTYPFVNVKQGDLRENLQYKDNEFDTVFTMRTLFAIGSIKLTLSEMVRICKTDGYVIFDYQNIKKNKKVKINKVKDSDKWKNLKELQESPDEILNSMENVEYTKYPLDMFLHYVKSGAKSLKSEYTKSASKREYYTLFKKHLMYRFFNSRLNFIPNSFWVFYERLSYRYPVLSFKPKKNRNCRRYLYVCKKIS